MKESVVLYEREFFEDNNSMWTLKPISIVDVKRVNGNFIWKNKEIPSIHDMRILDPNIDLFVGEMISMHRIGSLKMKNLKDAIILSMLDQMLVGTYNVETRLINYRSIKLNYSENDIEYKFNYVNKTEDEVKESLLYYEMLKLEYEGELTILSSEDLKLLNEIDDFKDLQKALKYLITAKENYFLKMQDESKIYLMYDKVIKDVLKAKNLETLKSNLNELIENIDNEMLNMLSDSEEEFSEISLSMNESLFASLYEIEDIDELDQILKVYQGTFKLENKQKRALVKKAPKTLEFYEFCYDGLEEILNEKDLKAAKTFLRSFNEKQIELLKNTEIYELEEKKKALEYQFDYNDVRNQLISRIIGRDTQIDRILTTIERNDKLKSSSKRQAMIIAGPTGTGKTQTFFELRNALKNKRPVIIVDTNQLTQEGYVGGSIENDVLLPLIMNAHDINVKKCIEGKDPNVIDDRDIDLARHGIVILDEIDKRAGSDGSVNTEGVVNQLLKLMDPGTSYSVRIANTSLSFDTSDLTIFASGAFQEYFDKKENQSIGFTESTSKKKDYATYKEVDPLELVNYGLDRQFVGRFDKVTLYDSHTKDSLIELENNKTTSNLQAEIDNYASMGISFVWEEGYIEAVVERAYMMKTGGRATKNIINRSLGTLNTEVNNHKNEIKTIFVPKSALDDPGSIVLIKKDNKTVLLKELMEETKKKNKELKNFQQIKIDEKALEEAKRIIEKEKIKIIVK